MEAMSRCRRAAFCSCLKSEAPCKRLNWAVTRYLPVTVGPLHTHFTPALIFLFCRISPGTIHLRRVNLWWHGVLLVFSGKTSLFITTTSADFRVAARRGLYPTS